MSSLDARLRQRIKDSGAISVEDWMQACLADPDYGYYMTRDPLGRTGDFTTAPEISQMFGELLGLWAGVVWQQMGSPGNVRLVELGPGRGTLMKDALRAARGIAGFMDALDVHLVETSPVLTRAQQQSLRGVSCPVSWHTAISDVPDGPVIVIANEFLDALPVRQFIRHGGMWCERVIGLDGDQFVFDIGDRVDENLIWPPLRSSPDGAIVEVAPQVISAVKAVAKRVTAAPGAALFLDYGYSDHAQGDTFQALRNHKYANPLTDPGQQDLTVHVNFAGVRDAASDAGARVWGPLEQGAFLERLGIAARAATLLASASKEQAADIGSARHRLVDADAMGRLFKVIALTHPDSPAPPAFETVRWA